MTALRWAMVNTSDIAVPILGPFRLAARIQAMTHTQRLNLTADFLEWTGGCSPETNGEIDVYLTTSMPFDYDKREARAVLERLMRRAAQAERRCTCQDQPFI
jgi:hypothetical protein